jgi:putative methionine-R-sulfoxide reductase with GAF domain
MTKKSIYKLLWKRRNTLSWYAIYCAACKRTNVQRYTGHLDECETISGRGCCCPAIRLADSWHQVQDGVMVLWNEVAL